MYKLVFKRPLDLILSLLLFILLLPLLLFISILILIFLGRPLLFIQERPGINEKIFKIYKFRTMLNKFDDMGNPLPDHQRATKFGTFLRKSSLDELPELFNVLLGDMSFIGPRPLIIKYLPYYSEREKKRHKVRPGITGLAQINGRNFLNWDKRLELDVVYVENISLIFDIKIILRSIVTVIKQEGVGLETIADLDAIRKDTIQK